MKDMLLLLGHEGGHIEATEGNQESAEISRLAYERGHPDQKPSSKASLAMALPFHLTTSTPNVVSFVKWTTNECSQKLVRPSGF